MAIKKWLCTKNTKNMVVKIVHPGGHKELHDRPILASEIIRRNPKCVVAEPHVFQQPWAVVAPDTVLQLGQKFYVVPVTTIRKLQRKAFKNGRRSPLHNSIPSSESESESNSQSNNNEAKDSGRNKDSNRNEGCLSNQECLMSMLKIKIMSNNKGGKSRNEQKGSSQIKRNRENITRGTSSSSPNRSFTPSDNWQPGLRSICEESI